MMLPIKRTARQRLETFANISRIQTDEETYDLEHTVVDSMAAGTAADRCGQRGACDRTVVLVDVGNREDDNMVMMPPLPPYSDEIREQLLAYGRAVAEAKDAEIAALRADAERYRWLLNHISYHDIDADWPVEGPNIPVLAQVSSRLWYHATDDVQHTTLDDAIKAAMREQKP